MSRFFSFSIFFDYLIVVVCACGLYNLAQADDYNITSRTFSGIGSDFFYTDDGQYLPHQTWGFRYSFAFENNPLSLRDNAGNHLLYVIDERYYSELAVEKNFGIFEWGIALPIIFQDSVGWPIAGITNFSNHGIGDVRVYSRARLLGDQDSVFSLHASVGLLAPTANVTFASNQNFSAQSKLTFVTNLRYLRWVLHFGSIIRESVTFANQQVDSGFVYGGGVSLTLPWIKSLSIFAEATCETPSFKLQDDDTTLFVNGGVRVKISKVMDIQAGYGHSVISGFAGTDSSAMLSIRFRTREKPSIERPDGVDVIGNELVLEPPLLFLPESDQVDPMSLTVVDTLVQTLTSNPNIRLLEIDIFANWDESAAADLHLASQRAKKLQEIFVDKGIEPGRVRAKGMLPYPSKNSSEKTTLTAQSQIKFRYYLEEQ
ncbi:MAG: hypothetical protein KDK51_02670 [Deltaproteobacteria bacterium]|nr:hypothetical protein [Deltaproteobacteria bacterium]